MKQPIDHILRVSLPWRDTRITECGKKSDKVISRDEFKQRLKEYGEQRASLFTCMTCMQTFRKYKSWQEDPRIAIGREIEWETGYYKSHGDTLKMELIAIEKLIEAHQDEFRNLIERQEWINLKSSRGS